MKGGNDVYPIILNILVMRIVIFLLIKFLQMAVKMMYVINNELLFSKSNCLDNLSLVYFKIIQLYIVAYSAKLVM